MGRYYHGDIDGKFMFAVQSSDAHERFGAVEEESYYVPYVVYRDSYAEICAELDSIKQKGHIDKVEKMFDDYYEEDDDIETEKSEDEGGCMQVPLFQAFVIPMVERSKIILFFSFIFLACLGGHTIGLEKFP